MVFLRRPAVAACLLLGSTLFAPAQQVKQINTRDLTRNPAIQQAVRNAVLLLPIDVGLAFTRCPTPTEIADLRAAVPVDFEYDPIGTASPCPGVTELQKRVYGTLLLMKSIKFKEPLPWTSQTLWDWFRTSVRRIRIVRPTGTNDYQRFVNGEIILPIQPNAFLLATNKFIDPVMRGGLMDFLVLLVHEARHAQKPHTCGSNDNTLSEMGAWAVQYHIFTWMASKSNLALTPEQVAILNGRPPTIHPSRFCNPSG